MSVDSSSETKFEIGHVLFIDMMKRGRSSSVNVESGESSSAFHANGFAVRRFEMKSETG